MLPARTSTAPRAPSRARNHLPATTTTTTSPQPPPLARLVSRPPSLVARATDPTANKSQTPKVAKGGGAGESSGLGFKAAWVAAEVLGNAFGAAAADPAASASDAAAAAPPMSRDEILASIREDFEANYFLTGRGDMRAYSADCLYADPFSSFRGTARFKKNVANFGAVVDAVSVELGELGPDPRDPTGQSVAATWRFSGVVRVLPWRPVLAASGSTRHVIDPAVGRVVEHVEEWRSSPGEVLARLWEPSNRGEPVNRWEAAFGALSRKKQGGGVGAMITAALAFRPRVDPPPPPPPRG